MKKSRYQFYEEISSSQFLHYSSLTNNFLLLNEKLHLLYETTEANQIKEKHHSLFEQLRNNKFLVDDDFDECHYVLQQKQNMIDNSDYYQVVVNTTLDCNLSCWYCYENRIAGSKLGQEVIEGIKKNIILHFQQVGFKSLKLSFFGGEPFMYFDKIKQILDYADSFCKENSINLIADFTTNATLFTREHIEYLKQFYCTFQITIDGGRKTHNKVKVDKKDQSSTYDRMMNSLKMINTEIKNRWISVRVNFDNRTLNDIAGIIDELDFLDRRKTCVILKKVWQLKTESVNTEALKRALQLFGENRFLVDYYLMPKGCVCFAERRNQVLFNYDGKIFKCTTLQEFSKDNSLGELDYKTGSITWEESKIHDWFAEMQPQYCKECRWFPSCLGICNRQIIAHDEEKICTFDSCNLSQKEYLLYLFKYNILKKELNA